ncbi:MAG TPA: molybdopterin cofactor-binding domain-containing protein [Caldimonas sp.]|nr:molybdopterin cofactor-binding domain-containing protein [Caldimonas sp.]HEV7574715.1 molybdopterin cofactor-binding domain-containing protein [Caldimonas sp.]
MTARDLPAIQVVRLDVNGRARELAGDPGRRLADALRDELGLIGTKIGCHAGDCGACTVLLDGEQVCSCIVGVGQCAGKAVTTVEGLAGADGTLSPLQRAFVANGAAQCGICTPGMLMSAAALLRANPHPDEAAVQDALAGVLCRCTGYRKIVEAVLAVGAGTVVDVPASRAGEAVGARAARLDAPAKVTGTERFGADALPGKIGAAAAAAAVLTMRVVRSPHPHARFEVGDLGPLRARWPGLVDIVSAADVPNNAFAIFADLRDQPVLADGVVRFRGEAVLALVGDEDTVGAIADADLPIRYTPLPAPEHGADALAAAARGTPMHARYPDNVLCRGRVVRGDVDAALAAAPHRAGASFETRHVEHAYIEPEAGWAEVVEIARPTGAPLRRVRIFACTQTPYMDRDEVASVLQIEPAQVHIVPSAIGGGFGGKLDLSVQPLVAVAAWKLGRAVRLVYERPESMQSSTKRHPAAMTASAACDAQGRLVAFDFAGDFNTGAYSSWGPTVANRVPIHASGPYRIAHVRALTRAVLTHNSVAGAFRGFGVPQSTLLGEQLIDELAERTGLDPLEFRDRNALVAGDTTPTGQTLAASVGLRACLDALRPAWAAARAAAAAFNSAHGRAEGSGGSRRGAGILRSAQDDSPRRRGAGLDARRRRGAGIACMWYGIGNTVIANPSTMRGALRWSGARGAHLFLYNGAQEIGQGSATIMAQMFADAVGLELSCVAQVMGDTDLTDDAGKSSASRQTFVSGNAVKGAGADLRRQLIERIGFGDRADADVALTLDGDRLVGRCAGAERALDLRALTASARRREVDGTVPPPDLFVGTGYFNPPTVPLDADGQGMPYATYAFAAQIAEVEVDLDLGTVKLLHIHAAHDVGRAINPTLVEGQIHGGIAQGIGMALMEEYVNGRTDNLHDYLIPTIGDVPPISVHLIEDPEPLGPWGAKGVGEPALVATAPAILNAIHAATGVRMREVPVTPSRLRAAILRFAREGKT